MQRHRSVAAASGSVGTNSQPPAGSAPAASRGGLFDVACKFLMGPRLRGTPINDLVDVLWACAQVRRGLSFVLGRGLESTFSLSLLSCRSAASNRCLQYLDPHPRCPFSYQVGHYDAALLEEAAALLHKKLSASASSSKGAPSALPGSCSRNAQLAGGLLLPGEMRHNPALPAGCRAVDERQEDSACATPEAASKARSRHHSFDAGIAPCLLFQASRCSTP